MNGRVDYIYHQSKTLDCRHSSRLLFYSSDDSVCRQPKCDHNSTVRSREFPSIKRIRHSDIISHEKHFPTASFDLNIFAQPKWQQIFSPRHSLASCIRNIVHRGAYGTDLPESKHLEAPYRHVQARIQRTRSIEGDRLGGWVTNRGYTPRFFQGNIRQNVVNQLLSYLEEGWYLEF